MANTNTIDPYVGLEAWEYTAKGRLFLRRFTGKHGEVTYEEVRGGQVVHLSPAERHLNSDKIRDPKKDPFKNGNLINLRLTDETPPADREEIENNPAALSDDQISALFSTKKGTEQLAELLQQIENPVVLDRVLRLAEGADLPTSKIKMIEARIDEVDPAKVGERTIVPAANELDTPEIYDDGGFTGPRIASAE